ncbi:MAG: 3-keto-disaccharide hydrolase [Vicinamibacterales bacterium]
MMIRLRTAGSVRPFLAAVAASFVLLSALAMADQAQTSKGSEPAWQPLFDGKTLTNWQSTTFAGAGAVRVENGQIILEAGADLTGINWIGPDLPTTNYEIALHAMRLEGSDFFAGVTFPVANSFCSLILGGWGGTVVGLSSINTLDASENQTSQSADFESNRWYAVRIRVTPAKIEVWLDERQIIDQDLKDNKVDTRMEVDPSRPLGVASWQTKSALRDLRLRRL